MKDIEVPATPKATVLMPVFNGEQHLRQAVDSILTQSMSDFELLVVDDASTDGTSGILESISDPRLRVLRNDRNVGIAETLNRGLAEAKGEFLARMDADDLSLPERMAKQIAFLEKHPDVGIVGTACLPVDVTGRVLGRFDVPETDLQIRWTSFLSNPFLHPTVVVRRQLLVQNSFEYDSSFRATEDYDLWTRLLRVTRGGNLPEPLVHYRVHASGLTGTRSEAMRGEAPRIALRSIREELPGFAITIEECAQLTAMFLGWPVPAGTRVKARNDLARLCLDMFEAYASAHAGHGDLAALRRVEAGRMARVFLRPPITPGSLEILRRLLALDAALLWLLARDMPVSGKRWLARRGAGG